MVHTIYSQDFYIHRENILKGIPGERIDLKKTKLSIYQRRARKPRVKDEGKKDYGDLSNLLDMII